MKYERTQEEKERLLNSLVEAESVTYLCFASSKQINTVHLFFLFPDDLFYPNEIFNKKYTLLYI